VLPGDFCVLRLGAGSPYDPTGFEQSSKLPEKHEIVVAGSAKSGALTSNLQELINIWRRLSPAERSAFLSIIRNDGGPKSDEP